MNDGPVNCPWCGVYIGPIPEHPCQRFREEPALREVQRFDRSVTDLRNTADGLRRYREAIR
jgi:hypothetical protein